MTIATVPADSFAFAFTLPELLNHGKSFCVMLSLPQSSFAQNLFVTLDELDLVIIDSGSLMDVRSSAQVLNDLPRNTLASPKSVSGIVDFRARIFASSSTLLACLISDSATHC